MIKIKRITVLGLGNLLCGDDGFGVHVVQHLQHNYVFPPDCCVIDGGTQGQLLYGIVEEADALLLIDAADLGLAPGSLALCGQKDIPQWLTIGKLGAHQTSFAEVLALGALKNVLPAEINLIGLQPVRMEFASPLSAAARNCVPRAEELVLEWLSTHGIIPEPASFAPDPARSELLNAFFGS